MTASTAQKTFELENKVEKLSSRDDIFDYDPQEQRRLQNEQPWKSDPHFFKRVRISAIALIKMVTHASSGGAIEVMGLMQGKVTKDGDMIVMDCFALPVEGTETRVNAQDDANEYAVTYGTQSKEVGRPDNIIGWYHSHPGYGCWLSGIDVGTEMQNQQFQDPFLAIVIDPNRTVSAGKVEIGAFRTYPENYSKPPTNSDSDYQTIPLNKIEDFGVHASSYYSLEISHFKSNLDNRLLEALWNKYWVATLSQSPLITNRAYATEQMSDIARKIKKVTQDMNANRGFHSGGMSLPSTSPGAEKSIKNGKKKVTELDKVVRDMEGLSSEENHGLITQTLKDMLFNRVQI